MVRIFNNPEFKTTVKKLGFVFILGFLLLCIFCLLFLNQLSRGILRHDQIMTGIFLKNHPEAEDEILETFKNGSFEDYRTAGAQILEKYGYSTDMSYNDQPALNGSLGAMALYAAVFIVLLSGAVFIFLYRDYRNIYRRVEYVTESSENVVEGKIEYLYEQGEGDFAQLGHSFNRMAERVKAGMDREKTEKEFLKNAISDISHQIRTPLASIMMFNELMLESSGMENEVREDFLKKSRTQIIRIQWLVESLLKMAMLESQTIKFAQNNVLVIDILEKSAAALSVIAKERNISLSIDAPEKTVLRCDEKWTVEACINMIKNALEHTPEKGQVWVSAEASALFTKIKIKDNGEGIEKKDLPHIFERFYRGGQTPGAESVGVGLSLAKLIIEGQGGIINVRSESHRGTEFEIVFPSKR